MININYVIDKTTKRLLRYGFSEFEIDTQTEELIDYHKYISLNIDEYYYKWDGEKFIEDGAVEE